MNAALGPFAIAAGLLVAGGALKARRPDDTAIAIQKMGLPVRSWLVRLGGAVEAAIGAAALIAGARVWAVLVAASYALFFVFVAVALARRLPIASCGCFGRADSPPSVVHLVIDLGALISALAIAIDPGRSPIGLVREAPLQGAAYAVLVIVGVAAAGLSMTLLPRLLEPSRDSSVR